MTKNTLEPGFFDSSQDHSKVIRLETTWLVDGATPNPVKFAVPKQQDLVSYLVHSNTTSLSVYEGIALMRDQVELWTRLNTPYNHTIHRDLLQFAILSAWVRVNPDLKESLFHVSIETPLEQHQTKTRSRRAANLARALISTPLIVPYYVGVNGNEFDVSEVRKPTPTILDGEIRQHLASIVVDHPLEDLNPDLNDNNRAPNGFNPDLVVYIVLTSTIFFSYLIFIIF